MNISTEATVAILTLGTVLPVGSLMMWKYCRDRRQKLAASTFTSNYAIKLCRILVKQFDANVLEARSTTEALIDPPGNPNGESQGSWTSFRMHAGDQRISISIGVDGSRAELLQGPMEDNETLAGTSNHSSGSERYELEAREIRPELA